MTKWIDVNVKTPVIPSGEPSSKQVLAYDGDLIRIAVYVIDDDIPKWVGYWDN